MTQTIQYFFYETSTGKITQTGSCIPADIDIQTPIYPNWSKGIGEVSLIDDYYSINDQTIKTYPARPSEFHQFDYQSEAWFSGSQDLIDAKTKKKSDVNALRAMHSDLPVSYQESLFDADADAIRNITSVILLGGSDGIIWRDYNNNNHEVDIPFLQGLASAIKDRNSSLYAQSWSMKADIDSIGTLQGVLTYSIDFN